MLDYDKTFPRQAGPVLEGLPGGVKGSVLRKQEGRGDAPPQVGGFIINRGLQTLKMVFASGF